MHTRQVKNKVRVTIYSFLVAAIIWLIQWISGLNRIWTLGQGRVFLEENILGTYVGIWAIALFFYWIVYSDKSNYSHIFKLGILPLSIFSLFFYKTYKTYAYVMAFAFILFVYFDIVSQPEIDSISDILRIQKKKAFKMIKNICFNNVLTVLVFYSLIYFLSLVLPILANVDKLNPDGKEVHHATNVRDLCNVTGDDLWEENKDKLFQLRADNLKKMSLQECIDAHQELLNIECEYLGVEPITLYVTDIKAKNTRGYFNGSKIVVDEFYFTDPEEIEDNQAIYTILHEVYHYYSFECSKELEKLKEANINMDLKFARDIQAWKDNQESYHSGDDVEDYYLYQSQPLETAANEYARKWYWEYLEFIYDKQKVNDSE